MTSKIQVYIKEYNDSSWTDITDRVVKTDFKLRSGFSSLGGSINISKLDITYRASNLAVAAIFHTTAKQIRLKKDGTTIWEGYTEGSSSVTSTALSSHAWVKISAYPYIHAFENVQAENDEVYFNVFMSNPEQPSVSLLHILWDNMVENCASPFGDAIAELLEVDFPTIAAQRSIATIEEGETYLSIFIQILKEYGYVILLDGFNVNFVQPYSDDYRSIGQIYYSSIESNSIIKSSPYEANTQPVVTLTRIVTKDNIRVYSLAESDTENAEEELEIGKSHPDEGDYEEVSYSNSEIEGDSCKLIYARNPEMTYKARYSDDSGDAQLRIDKLELGATSAKLKLTNTSTVLSCYLNQLWITAETAYFEDTSLQVTSSIREGQNAEETTKWLSYEEHATTYINALITEQRASTSSLKFKSGKLGDTYKPNDLIRVGDIDAVYIIKQIEENIVTGDKEYTCGIFRLSSGASTEYKKSGTTNKGPKGDKGDKGDSGEEGTSPVTCDLSTYSITIPADEDGLVSASKYAGINVVVTACQLYEGVYTNLIASTLATSKGTFQVGVVCPDITNWTMVGNEFRCTADSIMLNDSAEIKFTINYKDFLGNTGTFTRYVTVSKAYAGHSSTVYFAWSASETEFIPKRPRFFTRSSVLFNFNKALIGKFPVPVDWFTNKVDIYQYKDDVYKYLWCKTSIDGTPFLFTGQSGAYVLYQYALGDSEGNEPAESDWKDEMPVDLIGSRGFLWVRIKSVPAGGSPDKVAWGTPVIAGSDNVEVYQRLAENESDIATIVKSANTLESRVTKIDGENGQIAKLESSITQTANRIALKVDGTNVKDPAGIIVGTIDNQGVISLNATKILLNGSVTANLIDVANLLATDAFIKKLKAQNLVISNISGMSVEIRSTDDSGVLLSTPVFDVSYDGSSIFNINTTTGQVYINGTGRLNNAVISGTLLGADGTFKGQFETPAIKSVPNTDGGILYTMATQAYTGNFKEFTNNEALKSNFENIKTLYNKIGHWAYIYTQDSDDRYTLSYYSLSSEVTGCIIQNNSKNAIILDIRYSTSSSLTSNPYWMMPPTSGYETFARSAHTWTYSAGTGDKLYFLDIQLGADGLETNQVYRDKDGFLKIVI